MRMLLLGGTGQVGRELLSLGLPKGANLVAPGRGELDLSRLEMIADIIDAGPWHAVINAAAYTQVDRAESERNLAFAINAGAASKIASETARRDVALLCGSAPADVRFGVYHFCGKYPTPAIRPADTRLDCRAIARNFAVSSRPWREGLAETLDQLLPASQPL